MNCGRQTECAKTVAARTFEVHAIAMAARRKVRDAIRLGAVTYIYAVGWPGLNPGGVGAPVLSADETESARANAQPGNPRGVVLISVQAMFSPACYTKGRTFHANCEANLSNCTQ